MSTSVGIPQWKDNTEDKQTDDKIILTFKKQNNCNCTRNRAFQQPILKIQNIHISSFIYENFCPLTDNQSNVCLRQDFLEFHYLSYLVFVKYPVRPVRSFTLQFSDWHYGFKIFFTTRKRKQKRSFPSSNKVRTQNNGCQFASSSHIHRARQSAPILPCLLRWEAILKLKLGFPKMESNS